MPAGIGPEVVGGLVATLMWSTAFVGPGAVQPASELLLVAGRYGVFGLCGCVVLWRQRAAVRRIPLGRVLFAMHLGLIGYFCFYLAVSRAVVLGGGFLTAIIVGSSPICIAIAGNLLERRARWRVLAPAVALIFAGILLASARTDGGSPATGSGSAATSAVLLALLASGVWSYFVVVNASVQKTWSDLPDPKLWAALVAAGTGLGALALMPAALLTTPAETFSVAVLPRLVFWILWLGYVTSWLGTVIWVRASRRLPATLAGPLLAMDPVFGALLSLIVEGRLPTSGEAAGCLMILAGVAVVLGAEAAGARSAARSTA